MNAILPLMSTVISFIFAGTVFAQWLSRRKPHQLVWTLGLLAFGISAGSEFAGGIWGWNDPVYRLWYLIGAIFVAAYLGMGSVYLLAARKTAHVIMALLVLASLYAFYAVFTAPVNAALLSGMTVPTGEAMPSSVRWMTPVFNIFGTAGLVGGAAYSAWVFWRKRILPQRLLSCVLIAVGGVLPAFGGTQLRLGNPNLFFLMEFLGVTIIFVGFLANSEAVARRLSATKDEHLSEPLVG